MTGEDPPGNTLDGVDQETGGSEQERRVNAYPASLDDMKEARRGRRAREGSFD